jgi:hypothetical protein
MLRDRFLPPSRCALHPHLYRKRVASLVFFVYYSLPLLHLAIASCRVADSRARTTISGCYTLKLHQLKRLPTELDRSTYTWISELTSAHANNKCLIFGPVLVLAQDSHQLRNEKRSGSERSGVFHCVTLNSYWLAHAHFKRFVNLISLLSRTCL